MWSVTPAFEQALRAPVHTVRVRIDVLDTDLSPIASLTPTLNAVDGGVDVDVTRGNRRTFQLNLLNNEAEFSPGTDLSGIFYVDRAVRLWRGISYGDSEELVPLGTFLIDKADVIVERNMSIVTLSGQDFWKKLSKSQFTVPTKYDAGTSLNSVIRDMALAAGVTQVLLDPLSDRPTNSKTLNVSRSYEVGDRRGEELVKLCEAYGLDVYMDPLGRLVTEDFRDPADEATVWTYQPQESSLLAQLQASWDDEKLYNHVVVIGTGDEKQSYRSELSDTDPLSPTRINRIGDRTYRFESGVLASQESVDKAARTIFYKNLALTENVRIEAVCNPALEGNDVVRVVESTYSRVDARFRLTSFNVPLSTSKQTLHMTRALKLTAVEDGFLPASAVAAAELVNLLLNPLSAGAVAGGSATANANLGAISALALAAVASGDSPTGYAAEILADAPVAWWRLDETAGVFVDRIGANDGTATGTMTRGAPSLLAEDNDAVTLDGTSGYISVPDAADLDFGNGPFSIEMWVKRKSSTRQSGALFSKGANAPFLILDDDVLGSLQFYSRSVQLAVKSSVLLTSTATPYHIVALKNELNDWELWVNGANVTAVDTGGGTPTTSNTTAAINIGRDNGGATPGSYANVSIDEVALYDYCLTSTQINAHYEAGSPLPEGTEVAATPGALAAAVAAASNGDTLLLRGGDHVISTTTSGSSIGITTSKSLTLQNYPGETPRLINVSTGRPNLLYLQGGPFTIRGLIFEGDGPTFDDSSGSALLEFDVNSHDVIVEDCQFIGTSAMSTRQHLLYVAASDGPFEVFNCIFDGGGMGGSGFHCFHDPGPDGIYFHDNELFDFPTEAAIVQDQTGANVIYEFNNLHDNAIGLQYRKSLGCRIIDNYGTNNTIDIQIQSSTGLTEHSGDDFT